MLLKQKEKQRKRKFDLGDLVTVIQPDSLKKMDVVGLVIDQHGRYLDIYIPDISRSIAFDEVQLEKINEQGI